MPQVVTGMKWAPALIVEIESLNDARLTGRLPHSRSDRTEARHAGSHLSFPGERSQASDRRH